MAPRSKLSDGQLGFGLDVPVAPVVDGPYDDVPVRPRVRSTRRPRRLPLDPCADCGHARHAHGMGGGTCLAAVADGASVCPCHDYVETVVRP